MPPRGTTGKSSFSTGTGGSKSQTRTSSTGGRTGVVPRAAAPGSKASTSGVQRQAKVSLPDKGGAVVRTPKQKSSFERFQERYPGGVSSMPIVSIPPPVPGSFGGGARQVVGGVVNAARTVAGRVLGTQQRRAAALQKQASDLKRAETEIAKVRGPTSGKKLSLNMDRPNAQYNPTPLPPAPRGMSTWNAINRGINKTTQTMGLGKGKQARAAAAAVIGGSQEIGREIGRRVSDRLLSGNPKDEKK